MSMGPCETNQQNIGGQYGKIDRRKGAMKSWPQKIEYRVKKSKRIDKCHEWNLR